MQPAVIEPAHLHDAFRRLAREAGYAVWTWTAVENGDAADSYFWRSLRTGGDQSVDTFDTEGSAWRDCCETCGLLAPYFTMVREAGCSVGRPPGFLGWYWSASSGASAGPFLHASEAVLDCAITASRSREYELEQRQDDENSTDGNISSLVVA